MNALTFRNPFSSAALNALEQEMDSLFKSPLSWSSKSSATMPVDIVETDSGYRLLIDLPGVDKKDVSVEVKDGIITVSAERRRDEKRDKEGYSYRERAYGSCSKSFRLPDSVSESDVSASLKDGILEVILNKVPEAKPKKIMVN